VVAEPPAQKIFEAKRQILGGGKICLFAEKWTTQIFY
jgi:hypothetical protein